MGVQRKWQRQAPGGSEEGFGGDVASDMGLGGQAGIGQAEGRRVGGREREQCMQTTEAGHSRVSPQNLRGSGLQRQGTSEG